jgi:hypothetical protein
MFLGSSLTFQTGTVTGIDHVIDWTGFHRKVSVVIVVQVVFLDVVVDHLLSFTVKIAMTVLNTAHPALI